MRPKVEHVSAAMPTGRRYRRTVRRRGTHDDEHRNHEKIVPVTIATSLLAEIPELPEE
jgi:hypothetical protein